MKRLFSIMSKAVQNTTEYLPPVDRGMKSLDRSFFTRQVPLVIAQLGKPSYIAQLGKQGKSDLLNVRGVSRVVDLQDSKKGLLLSDKIQDPSAVYQSISESTAKILQDAEASFQKYTLTLDYSYWKAEEILAAVLPEDLLDEVPTGYTIVGHIAHINLRDEFLPYKYLIGQVILDKNPIIKTVVNKLDSIDTVYRTFDMEIIAGEHNFNVEQSESGCRFRFDFAKVYWNSRLHTEHERLIRQFQKGQAVCDVFAGVGPFAIPAGKKGVIVLANDLNPESYASMCENIKLNKTGSTVFATNLDGKQFIRESSARLLTLSQDKKFVELAPKRQNKSKSKSTAASASRSAAGAAAPIAAPERLSIPRKFSHYVMNLPDSAIEFLDGYVGLYSDSQMRAEVFGTAELPSIEQMPMIHAHCFYKWDPKEAEPTQEEADESMRQRVSKNLGFDIPIDELSFHKVRKVAPTKTMYCISFRLPVEVACR